MNGSLKKKLPVLGADIEIQIVGNVKAMMLKIGNVQDVEKNF